jgi:hypothetical protein
MSGIVKDAGRGLSGSSPYQDAGATRRARILATATKLRQAQSDEDAADALEAVLELSKE